MTELPLQQSTPKRNKRLMSTSHVGGAMINTDESILDGPKLDKHGFISQVAEKNPISNHATTGIYYWQNGYDYVKYAEQMIERDIRINGEYYVCPVYNEAIQDGKKFKILDCKRMWGTGTPEDLNYFLANYKV